MDPLLKISMAILKITKRFVSLHSWFSSPPNTQMLIFLTRSLKYGKITTEIYLKFPNFGPAKGQLVST